MHCYDSGYSPLGLDTSTIMSMSVCLTLNRCRLQSIHLQSGFTSIHHQTSRCVQSHARFWLHLDGQLGRSEDTRPRKSGRGTSVNHLDRTGDESGVITKEKRNKASNLFRLTDPVQRYNFARRLRKSSVDHVFDFSDHGSINEAPKRKKQNCQSASKKKKTKTKRTISRCGLDVSFNTSPKRKGFC